ncbi:MAG: SapC, partial [Devosia sp.]|nr:SapC [Devosia sp.]
VVQGGVAALVAILGIEPNTNLFVASDGTWLGRYVPAMLRAHPFWFAQHEGRSLLCIDESSGLAGPDEENARPFFEPSGEMAKPTAEVVNFLSSLNSELARAGQMGTLLHRHNLLEPWPIQIRADKATPPRPLEGLLRVNEAALNAVPDSVHLELRRGALLLAHAQLLSMSNLSLLPRIAEARQAQEQKIRQRRAEEAALFQPSGANQDVIDWERIFND